MHCRVFETFVLFVGLSACAAEPVRSKHAESPATAAVAAQGQAIVSGSVALVDGAELPAGATVEVELRDASLADAPSTVLAKKRFDVEQPVSELSFRLEYDAAALDPRAHVVLFAKLSRQGRLEYLTTESYPAITQGQPSEGFVLRLKPAS